MRYVAHTIVLHEAGGIALRVQMPISGGTMTKIDSFPNVLDPEAASAADEQVCRPFADAERWI